MNTRTAVNVNVSKKRRGKKKNCQQFPCSKMKNNDAFSCPLSTAFGTASPLAGNDSQTHFVILNSLLDELRC